MKRITSYILLILLSSVVLADVNLTRDVEFSTAKNVTYTTQTPQSFDLIEVDGDFFKADEVNSTITGNATMYIISYDQANVNLNSTGTYSSFTFNGINPSLYFFYRTTQNLPHAFNIGLDMAWDRVYTGPYVPVAGPGGDTSGNAPAYIAPRATEPPTKESMIEQCGNATFLARLFSKCRIEGNGICDDGENFLADRECMFDLRDVKELNILRVMWFLRFILIITIILLFMNSKQFPLATAFLLFLFAFNGAFTSQQHDMSRCSNVGLIMNAGYCATPSNPLFGWAIVFTILALFIIYFSEGHRKAVQTDYSKLYYLIMAGVLVMMVKMRLFFSGAYDTARCADIHYIMNAGYCIMPNKPLIGWIVAFVIVVCVMAYFTRETAKKKEKEKEKRRQNLRKELYTLK